MNPADLLNFEKPLDADSLRPEIAEKQAFGFTERFLKNARELADLTRSNEEAIRLQNYVVRELIRMADICKTALATMREVKLALPSDTPAVAETPAETTVIATMEATSTPTPVVVEGAAEPVAPAMEQRGLAGVERIVLNLLEETFKVFRVDVLGRTYLNVTFRDQLIEDPFQIKSETKGKTSELIVTEVDRDLWVAYRGGIVDILQRGIVICELAGTSSGEPLPQPLP